MNACRGQGELEMELRPIRATKSNDNIDCDQTREITVTSSAVTDYFVWFSCEEGYTSHRTSSGGSFFIQKLSKVLLIQLIPLPLFRVKLCRSDSINDFTVAYVYTDILMDDSFDSIILKNDQGVEVDRVDYNQILFPLQGGASMALADYTLDNNDGDNWCSSTLPLAWMETWGANGR